jgi:hypothetical protein
LIFFVVVQILPEGREEGLGVGRDDTWDTGQQ